MASYDEKPSYEIITETDYLLFYKAEKGKNRVEFGDIGYRKRLFVNACENLDPFNCTLPTETSYQYVSQKR